MRDKEGELLQEALNLTRKMRDAARVGDWESLTAWEGMRRALLDRRFEGLPPSPGDTAENQSLHTLVLDILDIDREVLALSIQARNEAETVLSQIRAGKAAMRAYRHFRP